MANNVSIINKTKFAAPRIKWDEIADIVYRELGQKLRPLQFVFVSAGEIQKFNRIYRGKNKPTNVLSFPETRDILMAPAVVKSQAKKYGLVAKNWMIKLFIHAILHLEGYAHEDDREASEMERLEGRILKRLKIGF